MFKFNFSFEEQDEDLEQGTSVVGDQQDGATVTGEVSRSGGASSRPSQPCCNVDLEELLDTLPECITYSPLHLPFLEQPLLRRDLHDARFQLASANSLDPKQGGEATDDGEEEQYVDAVTDLIPGLYEGGLKTWEGGVDLVEVLSGVQGGPSSWIRGSSVLEVGCGTALPSAYLLGSLLDVSGNDGSSDRSHRRTTLHIQDYNRPVLSLVSLPNLLLASLPYLPPEAFHPGEDVPDVEAVLPDLENGGELAITSALKAAFSALLAEKGVDLRFSWGGWGSMAKQLKQGGESYGLVLTAETIYSEDSVDELVSVLKAAVPPQPPTNGAGVHHVAREEVALEDSLGDLAMSEKLGLSAIAEAPVLLVAAKVLYFGVGGGLQDFERRVQQQGGWSSLVKDWVKGVGRRVIRIGW